MGGYAEWFLDPAQWSGRGGIPQRVLEHVGYSVTATVLALAVALPVAFWIGHTDRFATLAINIGNLGRAIPDLGVIFAAALLIGFTATPVVLALVGLAIPPILTNVYTGIRGVDPEVREAAEGTGLTGLQVLTRVEIPVALPLIFTGVKIATVQVIATATLAAFIGRLGGLGRYIVDGLALQRIEQAVGGAVLVAVLALLAEFALDLVERTVTSPGIRQRDRVADT